MTQTVHTHFSGSLQKASSASNRPTKMKFSNPATGRVQHPHPAFSTWGEQVEWFANQRNPEIGSYVAYDLNGRHVCGRVSNNPALPHGEILVRLEAVFD